jgi:hypothetical protein
MAPSIPPQGKRGAQQLRSTIARSVTALCMIACAQFALGADELRLRFDRSMLSQNTDPYPQVSRASERLPFIQREGAFDYVVDASHRVFERRAAGMSYDSRERLSPFSPPQRELVAFWSHRFDSIWKTQVFLMKGVAEGSPHWGAGAFAVYSF